MGTPQMRWREMHQSGRVAIMLAMRSSPQAGSHLTLFDFVEGELAEGGVGLGIFLSECHADEPLFGGAEDDGVVAAPAVRIAVIDVAAAHECAAGLEQLDDGRLALKTVLPSYSGRPLRRRPALSTLQVWSRPYSRRYRSRRLRGRARCGRLRFPGRR